MQRNYKYLLGLLPGLLVIAGNLAGGWWVAANAVFSLIILALLETLLTENRSNEVDQNTFFPDAILYMHVSIQVLCIASLIYSVWAYEFTVLQYLLMALSTGINSGASSIVVAHELIHRNSFFHRFLGKFLLFTACNFYFFVDHLRVHHKWVGTHRDHATARYGESVYLFFIRSISGQIMESNKMESVRLKNVNPVVFFLSHYVISSVALTVVFCYGIYETVGLKAVAVFILQALIANFLLEYTNYIEHYGLTRKDGERVTEKHSWQTDKVISRYFLIDLSRHADHHYHASKPYHTLKSYESAPVLPGGYVNMIYFALYPPLWFKIMHKRINSLAE